MLCNDYWFFEGGTILGSPDEMLDLGDTEVTQDVFMDFLSRIEQQNFRFVTKPQLGTPDFKWQGGSKDFNWGLKFLISGIF